MPVTNTDTPAAPAATPPAAPAAAAPKTGKGKTHRAASPAPAGSPTADLHTALEAATRAQLLEGMTVDLDQGAAPAAAPAVPAATQQRPPQEDDTPEPEPAAPAADEPEDAVDSLPEEPDPEEAADGETVAAADSPEPDPDFEAETEEELAHEATAKGWPKSASKRLSKLLKERHALKAQLEGAAALRAERDALRAQLAEQPQVDNPSTHAPTAAPPRSVTALERTLQQQIASREQWLDTLDAAPEEGLTIADAQGKETTWSPAQIRQGRTRFTRELARLEMQLENHRAGMAQQQAQYEAAARAQHAFLRDKTSREYQDVQTVFREFPEVARIPDALSVIADAIAWRKQQQAAARAAAVAQRADEKAKPALATRQPARPAAAPLRTNPQAAAARATREDFLKNGSMDSAKASIMDLVELTGN